MNSCILVIAIIIASLGNIYALNTVTSIVFPYKESITLNCSISNPIWYLNNKTSGVISQISNGGKFTVENQKLKIEDLRSPELTVEYFCNGTGGSLTIKPLPVPYMFNQEKSSTTVTEGGYATFQCRMIVGFQQGENITWTWKLEKVDLVASSGRVEIKNTNTTSDLTLRKITIGDKGNITCTADNGAGNHTQSIELRVKNTLAALWPFLAIVGEVIILCVIILVFEKKCAKKDSTSEDEAENLMSKQKDNNNNSDLKKRSVKA